MMAWALVFAADMLAALTGGELKKRRRKEMVGNCFVVFRGRGCCLYGELEGERRCSFVFMFVEAIDVI